MAAEWLTELDRTVFRAINGNWSGGVLDPLFAFVTDAGNLTIPVAILAIIAAVRGSARTRYALLLVLLAMGLTDLIGGALKELFERPRPYWTLEDVRQIAGGPSFRSKSGSFPSNHAANNFAMATMLTLCFPRLVVAIPAFLLAGLVALSRVYVGVHYPSDVLGGALIGAVVSGLLFGLNVREPVLRFEDEKRFQFNWGGLGLLVVLVFTLYRFAIVMKGHFPLAAEEAQYWCWSRHLDWSYYSKPPGIAYLMALGTSIFGTTELGVRSVALFSSVGMAIVTWVLTMRMFNDKRLTAVSLIGLNLMILYSIGAIVTTTDTPMLFCWSLACLMAWLAIFEELEEGWFLLGLAIALGLLAKYAMIYLPICLLIYLALSPRHRGLLKTVGPWLAIVIGLMGFAPVIYWNATNNWVSFRHVATQTTAGEGFSINPATFFEYLGGQAGVVGPGIFLVMLAAVWVPWRREGLRMDPRVLFLLSLGVPVFLGLAVKSIQARVLGNWAAPAYYTWSIAAAWVFLRLWDEFAEDRLRRRLLTGVAAFAVVLPVGALLVFHEPSAYASVVDTARKVGFEMPAKASPMYQFAGGRDLGKWVGEIRAEMPHPERTFIVAKRYQEASLLQFYVPGQPRTYNVNTGRRMNQFDLWGGFPELEGQDALYVLNGSGDAQLTNKIVRDAFLHVGEAKHLTVTINDQEMAEFTVYPCFGFRGEFAAPENVTY
ncbi:phosphatase PAP2 family protein [bacterium]|nr:phosphatase PAP2 family protein [bacterium]